MFAGKNRDTVTGRSRWWQAIVIVAAIVSGPVTMAQAAAGKYIVNSTLDTNDANPGDNVCNDGAGNCTLRAAIDEANAHAGKDTITFKITSSPAPWTISPNSALPVISGVTVIDGVSGTGANCTTMSLKVVIDGALTGSGSNGLYVFGPAASASVIKGLVITHFQSDGITIYQANKVLVQCNIVGLAVDGVTPAGNGQSAVHIDGGNGTADLNVIGGAAKLRNVLSGNNGFGVFINNIVDPLAKGNKIQSNYIGTDITGTLDVGNNSNGVQLNGATKTLVGGSKLGNVIAGNSMAGIWVDTSPGVVIQGNLIGVDKTGSVDLGNAYGIYSIASVDLTIGGKAPLLSNVISGSDQQGIYLSGGSNNARIQGNLIGVSLAGTLDIPNHTAGLYIDASSGVLVGGTTAGLGNIISGNSGYGIRIDGAGSTGIGVQGNFIGTSKSGFAGIGNTQDGIYLNGVSGALIGGTSSGARNLISGNNSNGIRVENSATGNTISGNYIGVNATSTAAIPNSTGIYIQDCTGCLVGGSANAAQRNVVAGNDSVGVQLYGGTGNQVFGNYVGTNAAGTMAIPNGNDGVAVYTSDNAEIGSSATVLARNVISGNAQNGVSVTDSAGGSIQGNYIGVNAAGTGAIGNYTWGIYVSDSSNVIIGGVGPAARNVIGNHGLNGIYLYGAGSTGAVIQGNYIGLNATGTAAMPNGSINGLNGVAISVYQANGATFGGANPGEGNVISGNPGDGVALTSANNTVFKGNIIGLDASGTTAIPNGRNGINISGSDDTVIGDGTAGAGNVISGNGGSGILLNNTSDNTVIKGNKIGTNLAGTAALGNTNAGISGYGYNNITIGGPGANDGNIVSGNKNDGIGVGSGATGTLLIQGNTIGADITRTMMLGNAYSGINSSAPVRIAGNTIAYNQYDGITQYNTALAANSSGNCLFYNLYPVGISYNPTIANSFINNWWGDVAGPGIGTTFDFTRPARQYKNDWQSPYNYTTVSPFSGASGCPAGQELITSNQSMEVDSTPADGMPDDWTQVGLLVSSGEGRRADSHNGGNYALKMVAGGTNTFSRTVTAAGSNAGHSIILGFWTRGVGVGGTGVYQASVKIGAQVFTFNVPVNASGSTNLWVHHTLNFKAPANFTSAIVTFTLSKQYGSVWWDDVSLMDVAIAP